MKAIWKFNLETTDYQCVEMPLDAEILTVQTQFKEPKLWCLVDTDKPKAFRKIRIIGTGHPIEENFTGKYIATYQLSGGNYVFHVFEEII
jgi:hypothetical protein